MGFILVVHIIVCVLLVICILLQAGRGGGLAESFSSAESMFGTQTNQFMVRLTTALAVIFLITSLTLAFNSSKQDKSLMTNAKLPPVEKPVEPAVTVDVPKPMTETTTPVTTNAQQ